VEHHARPRRQFVRLACNAALVLLAAAMAAGVWFAFNAWQLASQRLGMLSVALLVFAPILAIAVILRRPAGPTGPGSLLASDLVDAIDRVDDSMHYVRLCRAHVGVACCSACLFWVCQWFGYFRLSEFLVFFTAASTAAAAYLPWLASRERRLYDDRAEYRRLLGEFESAASRAVVQQLNTG
jgi:hypothetical protein